MATNQRAPAVRWTPESTQVLVRLSGFDDGVVAQASSCVDGTEKAKLWDNLATELNHQCGSSYTSTQCQNKWKNLSTKFRTERAKVTPSGRPASTWSLFDLMQQATVLFPSYNFSGGSQVDTGAGEPTPARYIPEELRAPPGLVNLDLVELERVGVIFHPPAPDDPLFPTMAGARQRAANATTAAPPQVPPIPAAAPQQGMAPPAASPGAPAAPAPGATAAPPSAPAAPPATAAVLQGAPLPAAAPEEEMAPPVAPPAPPAAPAPGQPPAAIDEAPAPPAPPAAPAPGQPPAASGEGLNSSQEEDSALDSSISSVEETDLPVVTPVTVRAARVVPGSKKNARYYNQFSKLEKESSNKRAKLHLQKELIHVMTENNQIQARSEKARSESMSVMATAIARMADAISSLHTNKERND